MEGRVEICVNGFWGTICDSGWDEYDAIVACRQVGYETQRAYPVLGGYFGRGIGPVHMVNVSCIGKENGLSQCPYTSGVGINNCYHGKDVGVVCSSDPLVHFTVTVTYEPLSAMIGSNMTIYCNVSPQPPTSSTYHWDTTVSGGHISQTEPSHPNATVIIHKGHPHNGNYYCSVIYNRVKLGSGHVVIHIKQGILYPTVNQYSNTGSIIESKSINLTVSLLNDPITDYFRELNWYHNGHKLNSSNIAYDISNSNKTLVLKNVTQEHFGEYFVQFDGLVIYPFKRICEQKLLNSLRHYPLLSPVVYRLSIDDIQISTYYSNPVNIEVIGFTKNDTKATLTVTSTKVYGNNINVYHDGGQLPKSITSSGILDPNNEPSHYNLTIDEPILLHSGFYEFQQVSSIKTQMTDDSCFGMYSKFTTNLGITNIVRSSTIKRLEYYEKPIVTLARLNNNQLMCSASGGFPQHNSIILIKDGISIASGTDSILVYNITDDVCQTAKLYQCVVDNTVIVTRSNILVIPNKISVINPPGNVFITPIYDTITLTCSADGAINYQWIDLSTGELVSNNSIHYISTGCSEINGQYQCTALNEGGNNTAIIKG
jgi:hypothetical protein